MAALISYEDATGAAPPPSSVDTTSQPVPAAAPAPVISYEDAQALTPPPADEGSAFQNFRSATLNIPGAFVGLPHVLAHTADWAGAKIANALTGSDLTGADVDKNNPIAKHTLSPEEATTGYTYPIVNAGRALVGNDPLTPYQPRTPVGELGNAMVTAGGSALVDPAAAWGIIPRLVNAGKGALAGGTADLVKNLTGSDTAAALSAFLAHAGASTAEGVVRAGAPAVAQTAQSFISPSAAGRAKAAELVAGADPTYGPTIPPMANPTDAALGAARGDVTSATGAIGPGLEPWQAGAQLRTDLQNQVDTTKGVRNNVTDPIAAARDASKAQVSLDPVLTTIGDKLRTAAGSQAEAINGALSDLKMPSGALRVNADQLAASRQAINARISKATQAGDDATARHLMDIRKGLDAQVSAAVPEAGQFTSEFSRLSKPLDPTQYGPVAKVLDRDQFNSRYTFPDERIPDLFLKSSATKSDLDQLTASFGGDRATAQAALEQHLAGQVQRAVKPDGTLDQAGFNAAVKPYQKALVWFPDLARKFGTAQSAQGTYEGLLGQRQLADSISNGGLRDTTGNITGASFNSWLNDNRDTLAKAHGLPTVMRLQQIGNALKTAGPGLAETVTGEIAPVIAGAAFGGTEGGILGGMLHNAAGVVTRPLVTRRANAFNSAIEEAVQDPAAAQRLAATVGPSAHLSGAAVKNAFIRALSATTRVGR